MPNKPYLRDRADMFYIGRPGWLPKDTTVELVTIDRPDREPEHRQTYDLSKISPASRARILRLMNERDWPTRLMAPKGWCGVSTVTDERNE